MLRALCLQMGGLRPPANPPRFFLSRATLASKHARPFQTHDASTVLESMRGPSKPMMRALCLQMGGGGLRSVVFATEPKTTKNTKKNQKNYENKTWTQPDGPKPWTCCIQEP